MGRYKTYRNNGYGRSLQYAATQAVLALYVAGHFGTVKELKKRARKFVRFLRAQGVRVACPGFHRHLKRV